MTEDSLGSPGLHAPQKEVTRTGAAPSSTKVETSPTTIGKGALLKSRRGPRAGRGVMSETILTQARAVFAERGYDRTTMREVARRAGCDPALITYYFGSKQQVFRASFNLPLDPASHVLSLLAPGIEGAAERFLDFATTLYEEHLTGETMQALMRALVTDTETTHRFREYFANDVLGPVLAALGTARSRSAAREIELTMGMMYGIASMRYIIRLEPLASMSREEFIRTVAPLLQSRLEQLLRPTPRRGAHG